MKKTQMLLKPLVAAVAVASGTLVLQANALPTIASSKTVVESICHAEVEATIAAGQRSVVTSGEFCQERSLPVTKGLVLAQGAASGALAEQAIANITGEVYGTDESGVKGALVLTPNRALSVSSSVVLNANPNSPALNYDLVTAVQPATGITAADVDGTYSIALRNSAWSAVAMGLESSSYAAPNFALGFFNNYSTSVDVAFNGDGTCEVLGLNDRANVTLRKDPTLGVDADGNRVGEMDNDCHVGGGNCGQIDGNNYEMMAAIDPGVYGLGAPEHLGWLGTATCSYTVNNNKVELSYSKSNSDVSGGDVNAIKTVAFDAILSVDKRYLVVDGQKSTGNFYTFTVGNFELPRGIGLGVRQGATSDVAGKTYAINALKGVSNLSTGTAPGYENPATPDAQIEQCLSRGQLTFNADGSCQLASVESCQGRYLAGYEEYSSQPGSGTVVDKLGVASSVSSSTECAWEDVGGGKVSVDLVQNGDELHYDLSVSDNNESLVGLGGYSVASLQPDVDNAPLLPTRLQVISIYTVGQLLAEPLTTSEFEQFTAVNDVTTFDAAAKGDFNGDDKADLFLVNQAGKSQAWAMDGSVMTERLDYGFNDPNSSVAAIHDFDGNGAADVLFVNANGAVSIQNSKLGGGADGYTAVGNYGAGAKVLGLIDINADGEKDILVQQTNGLLLALTMSGGTRSATTSLGAVETTDTFIGEADLDCDTTNDLVFSNTSGSVYTIKLQNGQRVGDTNTFTYNTGAKVVGFTDYNQDGATDVVVMYKNGDVAVLPNDGTGRRVGKQIIGGFGNKATTLLDAVDLNGDGVNDLIVKAADGKLRTLVVGESASNVVRNAIPAGASYVGAGDLNGNGEVSLVFENQAGMTHYIVQLDEEGAFASDATLNNLSRVNSTYMAK